MSQGNAPGSDLPLIHSPSDKSYSRKPIFSRSHPFALGPELSGARGTHGGQAGYADILLLGKITKRWELHDGPLWGRSINHGYRRTHSPNGPIRTGPN